jgi:hypothetical protein
VWCVLIRRWLGSIELRLHLAHKLILLKDTIDKMPVSVRALQVRIVFLIQCKGKYLVDAIAVDYFIFITKLSDISRDYNIKK